MKIIRKHHSLKHRHNISISINKMFSGKDGLQIKHKISVAMRKHGLRNTRAYASWNSARNRCYNPKDRRYKSYGGRGIRMCSRWRNSVEAFVEDMGDRPRNRSLDRKDNDGHYSCGKCKECKRKGWPFNCRWATAKQQRANQRPRRYKVPKRYYLLDRPFDSANGREADRQGGFEIGSLLSA